MSSTRASLPDARTWCSYSVSCVPSPCNYVLALLSPRLGWSRMRHKDTIPLTSRDCEDAPTLASRPHRQPSKGLRAPTACGGTGWRFCWLSSRSCRGPPSGWDAFCSTTRIVHASSMASSSCRRRQRSSAYLNGLCLRNHPNIGASLSSHMARSSYAHPQLCTDETRASALLQLVHRRPIG